MKKSKIVIMAVLLTIGFYTPANALLVFDVDFWSTDNANNNYRRDGAGSGDLGQTITLDPQEQINVDIYFSTDQAYIAGSWDLKYSPQDQLDVLDTQEAGDPWGLADFEVTPGSILYQDVVLPVGEAVTGDDIFFGSVLLQCTGPGDVDLVLSDYLGFVINADTMDHFDDVLIGTIHQTPAPGALWLLGSGLAGLIGLMRNRK